MRIYDNRLGRFLSEDPLSKSYPMLTPYQFASNSPILYIDVDGAEGGRYSAPSSTTVIIPTNAIILQKFEMNETRKLMGVEAYVKVGVGQVQSFQVANEIYTANWNTSNGSFLGYYSGGKKYEHSAEPNIGIVLAIDAIMQADNHIPLNPVTKVNTWNLPFDFEYANKINSLSPDAITASVGGAVTSMATGEVSLNETKILKGPDASFFNYYSTSAAAGYSMLEAEVSGNVSIGFSWALNSQFTRDLIPGPSASYNLEAGLKDGLDLSGTASIEIGYSGSLLDKRSNMTSITLKVGVEAGLGIGTNVAGGVTYGTTSETIHISDAFKKKE